MTDADVLISVDIGNKTQLSRSLDELVAKQRKLNVRADSGSLGAIRTELGEFDKSLKSANARVLAFGASAAIFFTISKALKEVVTSTIDVEKRLTSINAILGASKTDFSRFSESLFKISKDTAVGFGDVASAAEELARQGVGTEETLKRTSAAMNLVKASGIGAVSAVEAITAALNSNNDILLTAAQLTDKLVAVDQKFAVSSGGLAEAIKRVGSSASEAGVGLDELIAIVTSAQQITARGEAVIGNALKTIFTRTQRPKVLEDLENLGVATREAGGKTLPLIEILKDLSIQYDKLSSSQQSQISELVGGVYQINILKAIFRDLGKETDIFSSALRTSSNASGEAKQRVGELTQTLDAMLQRLLTNTTQLSSSVGSNIFAPVAKKIIGNANNLFEQVQDGFSKQDLGKSILAGLEGLFSGPVLIRGIVTFVRLLTQTVSFARDAALTIAGLSKGMHDLKIAEQNAYQYLNLYPEKLKQIQSGTAGLKAVQQDYVNWIIKGSQALDYQEQQSKILGNTALRAGAMVAPSLGTQGEKLRIKTASEGVIPDNFGSSDINTRAVGLIPSIKEARGALAGGYRPGAISEMTVPGMGRVVYNKAEKVKWFEGMQQPAIMPPQGSKAGIAYGKAFGERHGFNPYGAEGLVPNFAYIPGITPLAGRLVTNTIQPYAYTLGDKLQALKRLSFKDAFNAIILDKPSEEIASSLGLGNNPVIRHQNVVRDFPYRKMFGLKPRVGLDLYTKNSDGTYRFNEKKDGGRDLIWETERDINNAIMEGQSYASGHSVMGGFDFKQSKNNTGYEYLDRWDFNLNTSEKSNSSLLGFIKATIKNRKEGLNWIDSAGVAGGYDDPRSNFVRKIFSKITSPITIKGNTDIDGFISSGLIPNFTKFDVYGYLNGRPTKMKNIEADGYAGLMDYIHRLYKNNLKISRVSLSKSELQKIYGKDKDFYEGFDRGLIPNFTKYKVFHATSAKQDFSIFRKGGIGFHGGTIQAAEDRLLRTDSFPSRKGAFDREATAYRETGKFSGEVATKNMLHEGGHRIMPLTFNIKKPIRLADIGDFESPYALLQELNLKKVMDHSEYEGLSNFYQSKKNQSFTYADFSPIRRFLRKKGYDGIVYKNDHEGVDSVGRMSDSFIAFYPNQIKSIFNKKPDYSKRDITKSRGMVPNFLPTGILKAFRKTLKDLERGNFAVRDLKDLKGIEYLQSTPRGVYDSNEDKISLGNEFVFGSGGKRANKNDIIQTLTHEATHQAIKRFDDVLYKKTGAKNEIKNKLIWDSLDFQQNEPPMSKLGVGSFVRTRWANYPDSSFMEEAIADGTLGIEGESEKINKYLKLKPKTVQTIDSLYGRLWNSSEKGFTKKFKSRGFIPSFSAISSAISRESESVNGHLIRVDRHPDLISPQNPSGLGVYNLRDEPFGLNQGVQRAKSEGLNPKTYNIPNFAPTQISVPTSPPPTGLRKRFFDFLQNKIGTPFIDPDPSNPSGSLNSFRTSASIAFGAPFLANALGQNNTGAGRIGLGAVEGVQNYALTRSFLAGPKGGKVALAVGVLSTLSETFKAVTNSFNTLAMNADKFKGEIQKASDGMGIYSQTMEQLQSAYFDNSKDSEYINKLQKRLIEAMKDLPEDLRKKLLGAKTLGQTEEIGMEYLKGKQSQFEQNKLGAELTEILNNRLTLNPFDKTKKFLDSGQAGTETGKERIGDLAQRIVSLIPSENLDKIGGAAGLGRGDFLSNLRQVGLSAGVVEQIGRVRELGSVKTEVLSKITGREVDLNKAKELKPQREADIKYFDSLNKKISAAREAIKAGFEAVNSIASLRFKIVNKDKLLNVNALFEQINGLSSILGEVSSPEKMAGFEYQSKVGGNLIAATEKSNDVFNDLKESILKKFSETLDLNKTNQIPDKFIKAQNYLTGGLENATSLNEISKISNTTFKSVGKEQEAVEIQKEIAKSNERLVEIAQAQKEGNKIAEIQKQIALRRADFEKQIKAGGGLEPYMDRTKGLDTLSDIYSNRFGIETGLYKGQGQIGILKNYLDLGGNQNTPEFQNILKGAVKNRGADILNTNKDLNKAFGSTGLRLNMTEAEAMSAAEKQIGSYLKTGDSGTEKDLADLQNQLSRSIFDGFGGQLGNMATIFSNVMAGNPIFNDLKAQITENSNILRSLDETLKQFKGEKTANLSPVANGQPPSNGQTFALGKIPTGVANFERMSAKAGGYNPGYLRREGNLIWNSAETLTRLPNGEAMISPPPGSLAGFLHRKELKDSYAAFGGFRFAAGGNPWTSSAPRLKTSLDKAYERADGLKIKKDIAKIEPELSYISPSPGTLKSQVEIETKKAENAKTIVKYIREKRRVGNLMTQVELSKAWTTLGKIEEMKIAKKAKAFNPFALLPERAESLIPQVRPSIAPSQPLIPYSPPPSLYLESKPVANLAFRPNRNPFNLRVRPTLPAKIRQPDLPWAPAIKPTQPLQPYIPAGPKTPFSAMRMSNPLSPGGVPWKFSIKPNSYPPNWYDYSVTDQLYKTGGRVGDSADLAKNFGQNISPFSSFSYNPKLGPSQIGREDLLPKIFKEQSKIVNGTPLDKLKNLFAGIKSTSSLITDPVKALGSGFLNTLNAPASQIGNGGNGLRAATSGLLQGVKKYGTDLASSVKNVNPVDLLKSGTSGLGKGALTIGKLGVKAAPYIAADMAINYGKERAGIRTDFRGEGSKYATGLDIAGSVLSSVGGPVGFAAYEAAKTGVDMAATARYKNLTAGEDVKSQGLDIALQMQDRRKANRKAGLGDTSYGEEATKEIQRNKNLSFTMGLAPEQKTAYDKSLVRKQTKESETAIANEWWDQYNAGVDKDKNDKQLNLFNTVRAERENITKKYGGDKLKEIQVLTQSMNAIGSTARGNFEDLTDLNKNRYQNLQNRKEQLVGEYNTDAVSKMFGIKDEKQLKSLGIGVQNATKEGNLPEYIKTLEKAGFKRVAPEKQETQNTLPNQDNTQNNPQNREGKTGFSSTGKLDINLVLGGSVTTQGSEEDRKVIEEKIGIIRDEFNKQILAVAEAIGGNAVSALNAAKAPSPKTA